MTRAARLVLEDCRGALAELTAEPKPKVWRRRWICVLALLRAVGHVLDKVDGATDAKMRRAVDSAWTALNRSKPEPAIFWEFIYRARNNALKNYMIGAGYDVNIRLGGERAPEYRFFVGTAPYKGRTQEKVVSEAIDWWESYLDAIDNTTGRTT